MRASWSHDDIHPFDLTAVYRWTAPDMLDLTTQVTARKDLQHFESFLACYFNGFGRAYALVKSSPQQGGQTGFHEALQADAVWHMYPRDSAAVDLIQDGRWKQPPNPVEWQIMPELAGAVAMRRDEATGLAALVMAPQEDCFAVAMPYGEETHRSLYLSLFGKDLTSGQSATARTRLVIRRNLSDRDAMAIYEEFRRLYAVLQNPNRQRVESTGVSAGNRATPMTVRTQCFAPSCPSRDLQCPDLSLQGQFDGQEGVALGHGVFGTVEAIEDQLPEVREPDLAVDRQVLLRMMIDQIDVVPFRVASDVEIFAQLDGAVRPQDDGASVSPSPEAVGSEPVDTEVEVGPVVRDQRCITEVFKLRMFRIMVIGHRAAEHLGGLRAGIVQELFNLMAADVHQNAAVLFLVPEPLRATRRPQPMWSQPDDLQHAADGAVANQVSGMDGRFDMQSLGVVNGKDAPGLAHLSPRRF